MQGGKRIFKGLCRGVEDGAAQMSASARGSAAAARSGWMPGSARGPAQNGYGSGQCKTTSLSLGELSEPGKQSDTVWSG